MQVVGLVTEYNPFHNGHLYHLTQAKKAAGADYAISVMSGNFLQRGEPALVNKWARTEMALAAGVDLILEIPTAYATRSARDFALGSVKVLEATGVVTSLCFGSELGQLEPLVRLADLLTEEPEALKKLIRSYLAKGMILPRAQAEAIKEYYLQQGSNTEAEYWQKTVASPNNILGIEYLCALKKINSQIKPLTIGRLHVGYHETKIDTQQAMASATGIRKLLAEKGLDNDQLTQVIPETTYHVLQRELTAGRGPVFPDSLIVPLLAKLRTTPPENLAALLDMTEGIENRFVEAAKKAVSYQDLVTTIKCKRYTWARIQRLLCHILLDYTRQLGQTFDQTGGPAYIRVLGFTVKGRELLGLMRKKATLPLITRVAPRLREDHQTGQALSSMLALDVRATDLYSLFYPNPVHRQAGQDFRQRPVYVELP